MRGVVFTGERELELMQFPDPTPDAQDVVAIAHIRHQAASSFSFAASSICQ